MIVYLIVMDVSVFISLKIILTLVTIRVFYRMYGYDHHLNVFVFKVLPIVGYYAVYMATGGIKV